MRRAPLASVHEPLGSAARKVGRSAGAQRVLPPRRRRRVQMQNLALARVVGRNAGSTRSGCFVALEAVRNVIRVEANEYDVRFEAAKMPLEQLNFLTRGISADAEIDDLHIPLGKLRAE